MSEFIKFATAVHGCYEQMQKGELYTVQVEDLSVYYLAAFPEGTNPIFNQRQEYDCNTCKNFIRRLGKVIAFNSKGERLTVWDCHEQLPYPYNVVAKALQELILAAPIQSVYRTKERQFGCDHNHDQQGRRWNHFYGRIADKHFSQTPEMIRGEIDGQIQVFRRGLTELQPANFETAIDLIDGGLYNGEQFRPFVVAFQQLQQRYLQSPNKEAFIWMNYNDRAAGFRNTAIGSLLVDLAEGKEVEVAAKAFEAKVAPANYKRPTSLITPKMIETATKKLAELGLEDAIPRRHARLDDISSNDVLWVDGEARSRMREGLAGLLMDQAVKPKPRKSKQLDGQAITGEEFLSKVLPGAKELKVLVENHMLSNFMSLTAPLHKEAGSLFKWKNGMAWSYDGDVTDSIKERVKAAGGKIDALFRISLGWSNWDDLDLHVETPFEHRIYYGSHTCTRTGGHLDVDMNAGGGSPQLASATGPHRTRYSRSPVENVYWNKAHDGEYKVMVNNFCRVESVDGGFTLEVEFNGAVSQYSYARSVGNRETITALLITIKNGQLESIKPVDKQVQGGGISREKWGITTGQYVPVSTLMLSPNHWGDSQIGHKHVLFMLKDAKNPDPVRGIFNEFLREDLNEHRKVLEVLGGKTKAPYAEDQLSGLGFSSTRKDEVQVTVDGRPYLVKF